MTKIHPRNRSRNTTSSSSRSPLYIIACFFTLVILVFYFSSQGEEEADLVAFARQKKKKSIRLGGGDHEPKQQSLETSSSSTEEEDEEEETQQEDLTKPSSVSDTDSPETSSFESQTPDKENDVHPEDDADGGGDGQDEGNDENDQDHDQDGDGENVEQKPSTPDATNDSIEKPDETGTGGDLTDADSTQSETSTTESNPDSIDPTNSKESATNPSNEVAATPLENQAQVKDAQETPAAEDEGDDEEDESSYEGSKVLNEDGEWEDSKSVEKRVRSESESLEESRRGYRPTGGKLPRDRVGTKNWDSILPTKCIKQNVEDIPSSEDDAWQLRTPYFMLLGAMKCGTKTLARHLGDHPQIVKTNRQDLHFFDAKGLTFTNAMGVRRTDGRDLYQETLLNSIPQDLRNEYKSKTNHNITFDSTSQYILDSDRTPFLALCLAPWAKFVVLVRDPVERVLSHYNHVNQARKSNDLPMVDWREWIRDDMSSLEKTGVINTNRTSEELDAFAGSDEEVEAWKSYTRAKNSQHLIGRGLYAIQLRQWYAAMDSIEKNRTDLLVIQSEKLREDTQNQYSELLQFLDLDDHELSPSRRAMGNATVDKVSMPEDIRKELQEFYAPYNQQLYEMLGEEWAEAWETGKE